MAFTEAWDTGYVGSPLDSSSARLGAQQIRHLKRNIQERIAHDHVIGEETDEDPGHKHISFVVDYEDEDIDLPADRTSDVSRVFAEGQDLFFKPKGEDKQRLNRDAVKLFDVTLEAAISPITDNSGPVVVTEHVLPEIRSYNLVFMGWEVRPSSGQDLGTLVDAVSPFVPETNQTLRQFRLMAGQGWLDSEFVGDSSEFLTLAPDVTTVPGTSGWNFGIAFDAAGVLRHRFRRNQSSVPLLTVAPHLDLHIAII